MNINARASLPPNIKRPAIPTVHGITRQEVEERVQEAIRTLHAIPDRERRFVYAKQCGWPETMREIIDVMALALQRVAEGRAAYEEMREPREIPTKEAIDRMDEALQWLTLLDKRDLTLVTLRAHKMSWVRISWRYGKSDTTVQKWYAAAIDVIFINVRK